MPWKQVAPVIDPEVRKLCVQRYPGHPRGCPNHGKKKGCPPAALLLSAILDLGRPVLAVWNAFDFGGHVERMRIKHPEWSARQLACCLYWQGTARAAHRKEIEAFLPDHPSLLAVTCPEACGVNVTETMRNIGIELEWPPRTVAYQVALVGSPKE
ncbi:hypothetical protein LCGC14_1648750 [marine sediment metagenome]|uniref:Uncharacterized protein n=1 Tax=marine sediment metagenome TaxID=412755 RepID=A0A0F9IK14_9ZZZZ